MSDKNYGKFHSGDSNGYISSLQDEQNCTASVSSMGSANSSGTRNALSLIPLATIIFFNVSGGPFGLEEAIRAAGPFYTLLGFAIFPFIWSLPESLVTAELSSTYPHASGGVLWVEKAFGKPAGFMAGYLSYVAGVTDNAIYPVLCLDYGIEFLRAGFIGTDDDGNGDSGIPDDINIWLRFAFISSSCLFLTYINWLGLKLVGKMSVIICAVVASPFIMMMVVGIFQVKPSRWFVMPSTQAVIAAEADDDDSDILSAMTSTIVFGGIICRPFLNNLFWNLNSFDSAANYAEEVDNPGKTLPRALILSVIIVSAGYFFPLLIILGVTDTPQEEWVDGYMAVVALQIAGPILGIWLIFASGISNIGLFQAELSSDSLMLMGMARRGYVPKIFGVKSKHGTPTYALMLGAFVIIVLGMSKFDQLIEMLNFNYAISILMEYAAFIKLRISKPNEHRPFRIPLSTVGCILALTPAISMTLVVICIAGYVTLLVSLITAFIGIILYTVYARSSLILESCNCTKLDDEQKIEEERSITGAHNTHSYNNYDSIY